jgi:eukaryotic-like serine/threonine-protein kinase
MSPKANGGSSSRQVGRYTICEQIAAGGMATVHLAHFAGPLGFSRVVAAKRLHPHLVDDTDFRRMFLDEARLAARIRHPNVVPTLDVVVDHNEIILVMEYVHGESLFALRRTARERNQPIPLGIATAILVSVLHGLHAAHEAKSQNGDPLHIVHRDVSPQNILVGADGAVRVLDFGVAKAIQSRPEARPGTLKGKFSYMAPEVVRGEAVTRQADIFAAGVVLWELVTGQKLFPGANQQERLLKVLAGNYPAPSLVNADLPAVIDRITLSALHPDVASRYASALEMAIDIETSVPPASQRVVSEWLRDLAADSLDSRAELLQQVEVSHINSIPASAHALEAAIAAPGNDSAESGFVSGAANPLRVPKSVWWSRGAVAALLATLAIVVLLVRRDPSSPPQVSAKALPADAPTPALAGTTNPTPSEPARPPSAPQDSAATVARSADVPGSAKAPNRSRPVVRAPASQRPGPTKAPNSYDEKPFLPDAL